MTTATLTAVPTIREATEADVARIVEMGRRFRRETVYQRVPENVAQMTWLAHGLIAAEAGTILVAERDGALIGMLGLLVYSNPISGEWTAGELFFWVEPEHRGYGVRLLRRAEAWAVGHGASRIQMIAPTPEVETFYARLGYAAVEVAYDKALDVTT